MGAGAMRIARGNLTTSANPNGHSVLEIICMGDRMMSEDSCKEVIMKAFGVGDGGWEQNLPLLKDAAAAGCQRGPYACGPWWASKRGCGGPSGVDRGGLRNGTPCLTFL